MIVPIIVGIFMLIAFIGLVYALATPHKAKEKPFVIDVQPWTGPLTEEDQEYMAHGFTKVLINGTECYTRPSPPCKPLPRSPKQICKDKGKHDMVNKVCAVCGWRFRFR